MCTFANVLMDARALPMLEKKALDYLTLHRLFPQRVRGVASLI
jgi:hypothetical protein